MIQWNQWKTPCYFLMGLFLLLWIFFPFICFLYWLLISCCLKLLSVAIWQVYTLQIMVYTALFVKTVQLHECCSLFRLQMFRPCWYNAFNCICFKESYIVRMFKWLLYVCFFLFLFFKWFVCLFFKGRRKGGGGGGGGPMYGGIFITVLWIFITMFITTTSRPGLCKNYNQSQSGFF